jgi:hypothetical protein
VPEPHPVYAVGPQVFIVASCLASAWLAPRLRRRLERWLAPRAPTQLDSDDVVIVDGVAVSAVHVFRRSPRRSPLVLSVLSILSAMTLLWGGATLLALLLLWLPASEHPERLPGERLEAAVFAHAVPTTALAAADQLIARLERGGGVTRWAPPGALEARLVLAGRLDPKPTRAVLRLAERGYRTRAGLFALGNASDESCAVGLDALAESVRGGSLQALMRACRNAKGDAIARAAFKMGDFMRATGPESESIVSRLPRPPEAEPSCIAGGFDLPERDLPLCRLVHAELVPRTRGEVLGEHAPELLVARRWWMAMRAEQGLAFEQALLHTIDPRLLLERPIEAVLDEPLGVYSSLRASTQARLEPAEAAWVRLALAAERSAVGKDRDALYLLDEAFSELALGASESELRYASRLAVAIAVRAGETALAEHHAEELEPSDPLLDWIAGRSASAADAPSWASALDEGSGLDLLEALSRPGAATRGGLLRLRSAPEAKREALAEWLREGFPSCDACGFHAQLDRLTVRLDGARAIGDAELVGDLEPVVARFEAVLVNRVLGLSLRAASPGPLPE